MLVFATILGWMGILIFMIIIFSLKSLMKNGEYGLLHTLMAAMYAVWLPLPIVLYQALDNEILLIGPIFGVVYLTMIVISMILQTGHIVFISRKEGEEISDIQGKWIMATLSGPIETLANVFKSIWAISLAIVYWQAGKFLMSGLFIMFGALFIYFFIILINMSMVKPIKIFAKVRPNPYMINLETILFFFVLVAWISFA